MQQPDGYQACDSNNGEDHEIKKQAHSRKNLPRPTVASNGLTEETETGDSAEISARPRHSDTGFEKLRDAIPSQRSVFAEKTVVISIHNLLPAPLGVCWVDYEGVERYFCTVPESHRMTVETHATHIWKVYCAEFNLERIYVATSHPKQVCVIRARQVSDTSSILGEGTPVVQVGQPTQSSSSTSSPKPSISNEFPQGNTPSEEKQEDSEKRVIDPKRCAVAECNKKLKISTTHTCRCEHNFCAKHRYAEEHACEYDYKSEGKIKLVSENPVVASDGFRGAERI